MQTPLDDVTETISNQNKTKGRVSEMLQHHSPDTPLSVKEIYVHTFVSMVIVPGGKDHLKVCKKPIIFQTTLDIPQYGVYPPVHETSPAQQKQTREGIVWIMWFFMT